MAEELKANTNQLFWEIDVNKKLIKHKAVFGFADNGKDPVVIITVEGNDAPTILPRAIMEDILDQGWFVVYEKDKELYDESDPNGT